MRNSAKIFSLSFFLLSFSPPSILTVQAFETPPFEGGGGPGTTVLLSLFSISDSSTTGSSSSNISGHSWIQLNNQTNSSVQVGLLTISPYQAVTLGTYGNKSHIGLYYNLEYYFSYEYEDVYSGCVSFSEDISISVWDSVNSFIVQNDEWDIADNCSNFAIDIWNFVSELDFDIGLLPTPTSLKNQLLNTPNHVIDQPLYGDLECVGYYSNGTFVSSNE